MGSYCSLDFDELHVLSWKSEVPDFLISLFQELDRRPESIWRDPDNSEDMQESVKYVASRLVFLDRLDLLGITADAARRSFEGWLLLENDIADEEGEWANPEWKVLETLTYANWSERVPEALRIQFAPDERQRNATDYITRQMSDPNQEWLFFKTNDLRLNLRALIDACSNVQQISLDITDLINGGYLESDTRICSDARAAGAIKRSVLEPTIIIGEGSSDISILRKALVTLFPHLGDYFGFFDYDELRVDGGASYVTKFLRAFGGARISSRIVAVFDNDTAGREQFELARNLPLPPNIKVMRLPDIDLARVYPTVGPQGAHEVDVNGTAASIELYLGRQSLTQPDGTLTPVRWHTYNDRVRSYQGEIENKAAVAERFHRDLKQVRSPEEAQAHLPELTAIWRAIFDLLRN